jgi:hypothetical protein
MNGACSADPRLGPSGGGPSLDRAAHWLCLAVAPAFAVAALHSGVHADGPAQMICAPVHHGAPDAMTLMYALMSVAHAPPWLKLISRRRIQRVRA